MKYLDIVGSVGSQAWAMLPSTLTMMYEAIGASADDEIVSRAERQLVAARVLSRQTPARRSQSVAIVPIKGAIASSDGPYTITPAAIRRMIEAAYRDPEIGSIVLDIDSPGGTVDGVEELASYVRSLRDGDKKIVAVSNTLMASAAYWIGAQAHEVVVTPSSQTGSIGVIAVHQDMSEAYRQMGVNTTLVTAGEHKAESSEFAPLTDDARADIQARVDTYYDMMTSSIARGRGTTQSRVKSEFGKGRVMMAKQAVSAGLADRVDTLDNTINRAARATNSSQSVTAVSYDVDTEALASETLPFAARVQTASEEIAAVSELIRQRMRMRAEEGRSLGESTIEAMRSVVETARVIEEMLASTETDNTKSVVAAPVARKVDTRILDAYLTLYSVKE